MVRLLFVSIVLAAALCGCSEERLMQPYADSAGSPVPDMDSSRKVNEQDCTKGVDLAKGNLRCK
jgi:hypothetical protein